MRLRSQLSDILFASILALLIVGCEEQQPPLPIPEDLQGFRRYQDIYFSYELDDKDRMVTRTVKTYYVSGTEIALDQHKQSTYSYNEEDSVTLTIIEDLKTLEKSRMVYEYGPHGRGRYQIINHPNDTVVMENRIYDDEGKLVVLVSGSKLDYEEGEPQWIWRHERYTYDDKDRQISVNSIMTEPLLEAGLIFTYDDQGRKEKVTFYSPENDTTMRFYKYNRQNNLTMEYELSAESDTVNITKNTYYPNGVDVETETIYLLGQLFSLQEFDQKGNLEAAYNYQSGQQTSLTRYFYKKDRLYRSLTAYEDQ